MYPALVSTEAEARAWAVSGARSGSVVVADYQAAARGRGGVPWTVTPGVGLGFSLLVRPDLPPEREGWLYVAAASGLADVVGPGATICWPDEVRAGGGRAAAVVVHAGHDPRGVAWAVLSVLVEDVRPPRAPVLAALVASLEDRVGAPADTVLGDYRPRCATLDRAVRARMVPLGAAGLEVTGRAVDCLPDGALLLVTEGGRRVAVRPQHLGTLEMVANEDDRSGR